MKLFSPKNIKLTMNKLSIDYLRLISSLLVVAIHIYPFATINTNLDFLFTHVFCRIAVPLFIMITGYFLLPKILNNKKKLINYTKKIIKIYICCIILYLPINIYAKTYTNLNFITLIKAIFINGTFYHLWYFPALIAGIWIIYFLLKNYRKRSIIITISLLYLIGLFGDSYYGLTTNVPILKTFYNFIFQITDYTRNGLFYVPIFLYLGYQFNNKKYKFNLQTNIIFLLLNIILMEIEGFLLYHFNIQRHDSMYLFLIPTMFFIFHLLLHNSTNTNKKIRTISTIIYIIHPLVIIILRAIAKILNLQNILINNNLIQYFIVVLSSILISIIIEKIRQILKIKSIAKEKHIC